MKNILSTALAFLSVPFLFAQTLKPSSDLSKVQGQAIKSPEIHTPLAFEIGEQKMDMEWKPVIKQIVGEHEAPENEAIKQYKEQVTKAKFEKMASSERIASPEGVSTIFTPVLGKNFVGNSGAGECPLDNTIAISNGGKIISMINGNVSYYNDTSATAIFSTGLYTFFNNSSIVGSVCDPKVIYDSGADRFIVYAQTCDPGTAPSKVLLAFSKSNNPQGGWWVYILTGDPLSDNSFFDYPKLAVSNNEVYVTGNLFDATTSNYNESVLYQINKNNGYSGAATLSWQNWHSIPGSPFTLTPVGYGHQGNYGPGIYLVSTRAAGGVSSFVNFYDLTDDMTATNEALNYSPLPCTGYTVAGDAAQLSGGVLNTGDNRAQNGFYLGGYVHFVFHSDVTNGFAGINYHRIKVSNLAESSSTKGDGSTDFVYPAVASFTKDTNDKAVMIAYVHSSSTIHPEVRVIHCDNFFNWSTSVLVKAGVGAVNQCTQNSAERWGDYTGISRKHSSTKPSVWLAGSYANNNGYWNTWISEVHATSQNFTGIPSEQTSSQAMSVFPNPVIDEFQTGFSMPAAGKIRVTISDLNGKQVKDLFEGNVAEGENTLSFNKGNLASGLYLLQILDEKNKSLKNEKFIISR